MSIMLISHKLLNVAQNRQLVSQLRILRMPLRILHMPLNFLVTMISSLTHLFCRFVDSLMLVYSSGIKFSINLHCNLSSY